MICSRTLLKLLAAAGLIVSTASAPGQTPVSMAYLLSQRGGNLHRHRLRRSNQAGIRRG